jgi:hypothetical protein
VPLAGMKPLPLRTNFSFFILTTTTMMILTTTKTAPPIWN